MTVLSRLLIVSWFLLLLSAGLIEAKTKSDKWQVHSLTLSGNKAFSQGKLKKVMITRTSHFWSRSYYKPMLFKEDLNTLILFYKQNGYLKAQIRDTSVTIDSTKHEVDIRLEITEGLLSHIQGLEVSGNTVFPDSLLLALSAIQPPAPYRYKAATQAAMSIEAFYGERGHLNAVVKPEILPDPDSAFVRIRFNIQEGPFLTIGQLSITGQKKTKLPVIRRELWFETGDTLRRSALSQARHQLYLTGLFRSVYLQPAAMDSSDSAAARDIIVEVQEKPSIELNTSVGYGTEEKGRLKVEALNNNLYGTARKIGLKAKLSFIGYGSEASFTEPWTFGSRIKTNANLFWDYLEETGYTITKTGGRLLLGRKFGSFITGSVGTRFENSYLKDIKLVSLPDTLTAFVRSLMVAVNYDSRDDLFDTRRGVFAELSNEFAGPFLSNTTLFSRSIARLKYFRSVWSSGVLASALETGWIIDFSDRMKLPPNERFYAGGSNSLRGFDYRSVGPKDENGVAMGGRFKIVFNMLELRQTVYKMVGVAAFFELGNVWSSIADFRPLELRPCVGLGPRIETPIGIIRADASLNPAPRAEESAWVFYLSVGQAF